MAVVKGRFRRPHVLVRAKSIPDAEYLRRRHFNRHNIAQSYYIGRIRDNTYIHPLYATPDNCILYYNTLLLLCTKRQPSLFVYNNHNNCVKKPNICKNKSCIIPAVFELRECRSGADRQQFTYGFTRKMCRWLHHNLSYGSVRFSERCVIIIIIAIYFGTSRVEIIFNAHFCRENCPCVFFSRLKSRLSCISKRFIRIQVQNHLDKYINKLHCIYVYYTVIKRVIYFYIIIFTTLSRSGFLRKNLTCGFTFFTPLGITYVLIYFRQWPPLQDFRIKIIIIIVLYDLE